MSLVGRYYDPGTGQFLSVDPDVAETGQPYAYTGDDPVNGTDPLGLYWGEGTLDDLRHDVASNVDANWNGIKSFATGLVGTPSGCKTNKAAYDAGNITWWADAIGGLFGDGATSGTGDNDEDDVGDTAPASEGVTTASSYTYNKYVDSIEQNGMRPGTFATPSSGLSPLQAQIELSLSPERGLPDVEVEIDLEALQNAGYTIPSITRISNVVTGASGRVYSMPGGGYEMQFPYPIPPQFIKVVSK